MTNLIPMLNEKLEFTVHELMCLRDMFAYLATASAGYTLKELRVVKSIRAKISDSIGEIPPKDSDPNIIDIFFNKTVFVIFTPDELSYIRGKLLSFDKFIATQRVMDSVISLAEKLNVE